MRAVLGPLFVAAGAWCAAGVLTVASPDNASVRLAMLAPWWVFAGALVLAYLVPAWRRRPTLAAPALLSTMPWWPIPLPPIALIWTGPLAWMPIGAAVLCACGTTCFDLPRRLLRDDPRRSTIAAALLTLACCGWVAWSIHTRLPGGDEPHYLIITQSLLKDHDIQIENNHRQRDYAEYYGGEIAPDYVKRGKNGEIYSIHAPGISALVAPAFALYGYRGVQLFLLLITTVTGALIWRFGWQLTGDVTAGWFAWAAVAGSVTFLLQSSMVFPDAPGALCVAAAVLLLARLDRAAERVRVSELLVVSVLMALLPWLHTRLAAAAAGLGLLVVIWVLRDSSRARPARRARALAFLVVPALSAVAWIGFFVIVYGTPNPTVPYGANSATQMAFLPGGFVGLLFDAQFGIAAYAPVFLLIGAWLASPGTSPSRRLAMCIVAVSVLYLAAVATFWLWWGGTPSGPGRLTFAALPMFAVPLALLWHRGGVDRRMHTAVLTASLVISFVVTSLSDGELAWNMRDAQSVWLEWLGPLVNLPRAWPSFFWALDPSRLNSEWPFVIHIAMWLSIFVAGWIVARRFALRSDTRAESARLVVACWLLGGVMLSAQAGWWFNGVSGLDPARSQSRVLAAAAPIVELAPLRVRGAAASRLVIGNEEPGRLEGQHPWLDIATAPRGLYSLRISTPHPRAGTLTVRAGREALPLMTIPVQAMNRQTASLDLPVGVKELTIVASPSLEDMPGALTLEPIRVDRGVPAASLVAKYGAATVYFFDDHVHTETDGFWVKGGQTAALAMQGDAGIPPSLSLQNGRGENEIVLTIDGTTTRERFTSFETRRVPLPASAAPVRHVAIGSTSGFRPSDDGTSKDDRYLGVRVTVN